MKSWNILFLVNLVCLVGLMISSCKSIGSNEYGIIQDTENRGTFYFRLYEGEDLKNIIKKNSKNLSKDYTNLGCIVCRFTCDLNEQKNIDYKNVHVICNKDPRYVSCSDIGFDEKSITYQNRKKDLESELVITNTKDRQDLYEYFEKRLNLFEKKFLGYYDTCAEDIRYLCPIKQSVLGDKLAVVFDNTWEEYGDGIYKLNDIHPHFYHATDGKLYSANESKDACKKWGNYWRLITNEEFDFVNKKNMAVIIPGRMNLGEDQCFVTYNSSTKEVQFKSFSERDCSNETQGRIICFGM